jgi:ubiquitin-conjugating enzyme E2 O
MVFVAEYVSIDYCLQLLLDGNIQVIHPDQTVKVYPLERLTKLYDGIDQLEDDLYEPSEAGSHQSAYFDDETWSMNENGEWMNEHGELLPQHDLNHSYPQDQYAIFDEEGYPVIILPEYELPPESGGGSDNETPSPQPPPLDMIDIESPAASSPIRVEEDVAEGGSAEKHGTELEDDEDEDEDDDDSTPWKRFDILPSAPPDHAYYATTPSQPTKAFHVRLAREYRILQSSLPGKISTFSLHQHVNKHRVRLNYRSCVRRSRRPATVFDHRTE